MKWNLRNRILIPTVTLLLVTTAAISTVSYWMSRNSMDSALDDQLTQICDTSIREVDSWIEAQRLNIVHWSIQPHVLVALGSSAESNATRETISAELAHAEKTYGIFSNLQLIDLKGESISSSRPESIGTLNVADRQYFKDAIAGKVVISEVLKSRTTGGPIVVIAAPVMEGTVVRGVIFGSLDMIRFNETVVAKIKVLQTGYAVLYDETGVFIGHPDKTKIMTTKLSDFEWGRTVLQQKNGEIYYTWGGIQKMARFRTSEKLHWGVLAAVPMSEILASSNRMGRVNITLGIAAALLGIAIMWVTARSITRPISGVADQLSAGARETNSAANQVSVSSQDLAEGATEQAASLEETSSSLEEMSSVTKRNAESAGKANTLAREARLAADTGASDMQTMTTAMQDIKTSSDDIAKIIKTIDEIAFQTNILALNAAVEAARAGEAGAGFAVVADEVRALAQRAAAAARETAGKIEGAITKTAQGVQISDKVSKSLNEIVDKVRQVDALVAEVSTASHEQSQGVGQIATAVNQMDKVVQSNAASAEESASASEELNAQATVLQHVVSELLTLIDGADHTVKPEETIQHKNHSKPFNTTKSIRTRPDPRQSSAVATSSGQTHTAADFKDM